MTLRPFFSFYGGKWRAAPLYDPPSWPVLVEPFAGSAGYALRHPQLEVRLYDADPVIVALWQYLIRVDAAEIMRLPASVEHVDDLRVCEEARSLIGFWLNKGMTAPCKTPSKWLREGRRPDSTWGPAVRAMVAGQVAAIRHWRAELRSWEDVPVEPATWFVDPPYSGPAGRRYRYSDVGYAALGAWCRSLPGQVIVCEQAGACWLPFRPFAVAKTAEGRGRTGRSHEVVWP